MAKNKVKPLTVAQRSARAAERMEQAASELFTAGAQYGGNPANDWSRQSLMRKARAYAASVNALTRVRAKR